MLSYKYAASCLYCLLQNRSVTAIHVFIVVILCEIFFCVCVCTYCSYTTMHVIYMANSTAKLLLKNAKRQCCRFIFHQRTRRMNSMWIYVCIARWIAIGQLYIHWSDKRHCVNVDIVPGNFVTFVPLSLNDFNSPSVILIGGDFFFFCLQLHFATT